VPLNAARGNRGGVSHWAVCLRKSLGALCSVARREHRLELLTGFTLKNLHMLPFDYLLAFPNHWLCALGAKRRDYFTLVSHWLPSNTAGAQDALGHRNAVIRKKFPGGTFHDFAIS
jgi:hypothetical protein